MLFDLMMNGEGEEESERFNTESLVKIKNVIGFDVKFEQTQTSDFPVDMPSDEMLFIETSRVHPSSFSLGPVVTKKFFKILNDSMRAHFGSEPQFFVKKFLYKERNNFPLDLVFSIKVQTKYTASSISFLLAMRSLKLIADHIPEEYTSYKVDGKLPIYQSSKFLIDPTVFSQNPALQNVIDECIKRAVLGNGVNDLGAPSIEILSVSNGQVGTISTEIEKVVFDEEELSLHYGKDFPSFDKTLRHKLLTTSKGIALLHGPPGCGKTFYIRYLIASLKKEGKRLLLIPKNVLDIMATPEFTEFMISEFSNSNAVIIIEDAEALLRKRDEATDDGRAAVSTLLNLSDGLLNDMFKLQFICTFNTALDNIDSAILRKKRLLALRYFKPLTQTEAQELIDSKELGKEATGAMTLSEIYSLEDEEDDKVLLGVKEEVKKKKIGFQPR
jgi:hypothetical protein